MFLNFLWEKLVTAWIFSRNRDVAKPNFFTMFAKLRYEVQKVRHRLVAKTVVTQAQCSPWEMVCGVCCSSFGLIESAYRVVVGHLGTRVA